MTQKPSGILVYAVTSDDDTKTNILVYALNSDDDTNTNTMKQVKSWIKISLCASPAEN